MIEKNVVDKDAEFAIETIAVTVVTAVSQTDLVAFKFTPGYAFEIVGVRSYCAAKAGAVAGKVKVATREAVAALAFTAATEVGATLSATAANIKGTAAEAISIEYTSDGTGVLTNGVVVIKIRPLGLATGVSGGVTA